MDTDIRNHEHNGVDSKRLNAGQALVAAPQATIESPAGGANIDAEARAAIDDIILALQALHLIR